MQRQSASVGSLQRRSLQRGFTLIELLVATAILGIAVAALLGALSDSVRASVRVSEYDKATLLAKQKMEELLVDSRFPRFQSVQGKFSETSGWSARRTPWDYSRPAGLGATVIDRTELEVWWLSGSNRRTIKLEGYRRGILQPEDFAGGTLRQ